MAEKELDLGLDKEHSRILREEAAKEPCFGGCGKSYAEANGGWFTFEKVEGRVQLAPRWYCDDCFSARPDSGGEKANSDPVLH